MHNSDLITPQHLARKAVIYIRQSTPHQVLSHEQSALRADSENISPFLRAQLVGRWRHMCLV